MNPCMNCPHCIAGVAYSLLGTDGCPLFPDADNDDGGTGEGEEE